MRTVLVTGSDTDVGKTHVVGALAKLLAAQGTVQIVKPIESGGSSDAENACRAAACGAPPPKGTAQAPALQHFTLFSFPDPIAPATAAQRAGAPLSLAEVLAAVHRLPPADYRIIESAGGIASPLDAEDHDWSDFARSLPVDAVLVVIPNRVGAIGQARMAYSHALRTGLHTGLCLNACTPADSIVNDSNIAGLKAAGIPIWAELAHAGTVLTVHSDFTKTDKTRVDPVPMGSTRVLLDPADRARGFLVQREGDGIRRRLRVPETGNGVLNLADNDYLGLSRDPVLAKAVGEAAQRDGTSAAASALITGWGESHERLTKTLCKWHGLKAGLLWSSGYAANSAVLGTLPQKGDLVLADRLIHHSMIAGILRSGARLQRYDHLRLDRLEESLAAAVGRTVFVATESVFSMDGDYPDLCQMAELRRRYGFYWIVDEAHALGWYGPEGAGLVRAAGVEADVDLLVGTFGKALGSGGAYTLFRDEPIRDQLINAAGEFIYSTALPPTTVAAAAAAIGRCRELAPDQSKWHALSRDFRARLRDAGWNAADGDSPIVPVVVGEAARATALADQLRSAGILAGAVRPPTVPEGSSRLRFSLKRTLSPADAERVVAALAG